MIKNKVYHKTTCLIGLIETGEYLFSPKVSSNYPVFINSSPIPSQNGLKCVNDLNKMCE